MEDQSRIRKEWGEKRPIKSKHVKCPAEASRVNGRSPLRRGYPSACQHMNVEYMPQNAVLMPHIYKKLFCFLSSLCVDALKENKKEHGERKRR